MNIFTKRFLNITPKNTTKGKIVGVI